MKHLVIQNVGPLKSIDITLKKVNVFIGMQSSGKSTIAKIISFCSWLDKLNSNVQRTISLGAYKSLETFHNFHGYLNAESEILYTGDNIVYLYSYKKEPSITIPFDDYNSEHYNEFEWVFSRIGRSSMPKVMYIPAERNFVSAVSNLGDYLAKEQTNLQHFLNTWYYEKRSFDKNKSFEILNLGAKYYFNNSDMSDHVLLSNGKDIMLHEASSGLQSLIPMIILIDVMAHGVYKNQGGKPFSPNEEQQIMEMLSQVRGNELDSDKQEMISRLSAFVSGKIYTHTQFIIEEPEQNLFPETQMDFLYYLLSEINHGRNHHLVLTTHSPYILYALNNCMLAWLVKDKIDSKEELDVKSLQFALNPQDVSVWSLKDGYLKNEKNEIHNTIQDKRGLIRKNYFNDIMKKVMGDFNTLLDYDD